MRPASTAGGSSSCKHPIIVLYAADVAYNTVRWRVCRLLCCPPHCPSGFIDSLIDRPAAFVDCTADVLSGFVDRAISFPAQLVCFAARRADPTPYFFAGAFDGTFRFVSHALGGLLRFISKLLCFCTCFIN